MMFFKEKKIENITSNCTICFEDKYWTVKSACGGYCNNSVICVECFLKLKKSICPVCRRSVSTSMVKELERTVADRHLLKLKTNGKVDWTLFNIQYIVNQSLLNLSILILLVVHSFFLLSRNCHFD